MNVAPMVAAPRKVYVAIPALDAKIHFSTMKCLMEATFDALLDGTVLQFQTYNEAPISHARNMAVADFRAGDCDDLFFVDADVAWETGAMQRVLRRPAQIVCGCYPHRAIIGFDSESYPIMWDEGQAVLIARDPVTLKPADDGLLSIKGTGSGFLRVTRAAIDAMVEKYSDEWYYCKKVVGGKVPALFSFDRPNHQAWSEDMTFFGKWRAMGGTVWLEPDIDFMHFGETGFGGNVAKWLKARPEYVDASMMRRTAKDAASLSTISAA